MTKTTSVENVSFSLLRRLSHPWWALGRLKGKQNALGVVRLIFFFRYIVSHFPCDSLNAKVKKLPTPLLLDQFSLNIYFMILNENQGVVAV